MDKDSKLLDVGAGTGIIARQLKQKGFSDLHALDASEAFVSDLISEGNYKTVKGEKIEHDLGYGATTTIAKPRLYLAMNPGYLKLVKVKVPVASNADGLKLGYSLIDGAHFASIRELEDEQADPDF